MLAACAGCGETLRCYDLRQDGRGRAAAAGRGRLGAPVLLKADTALELGPPGRASCALALVTSTADLVSDGVATHVGPDFPDLRGAHDFALVALAAGERLGESHCRELGRALFLAGGEVAGFMVRGNQGRLWCRVGQQAWGQGLALEGICRALYRACRARVPQAGAVELVAVVAAGSVVRELEGVAAERERVLRTLERYRRVEQDTYECQSRLDCDACPDSKVCDTIREIVVLRKGKREVRLEPRGREKR